MLNFEKEIKIARIHNVLKLKASIEDGSYLDDKDLLYKIHNVCDRFNIQLDAFVEDIIRSEYLAYYLAKDPKKQNIAEQLAAQYISQLDNVHNFINLSNGAYLVYENHIYTIDQIESLTTERPKTLDFTWTTKDYLCVATQKFTEGNGGAQDNQRKDVELFIKHTNAMNTVNYNNKMYRAIPFAIIDGSYYTNNNSRGISHLDKLSALASGTCKVTSINNLNNILNNL